MKFPFHKMIVPLICIAVSGISCKKFLASYSQNKSFIETAADLDELLVGDAYDKNGSLAPLFVHLMDDDVEMGRPEGSKTSIEFFGLYSWQSDPRINSEGRIVVKDDAFNGMYKSVSTANVVLLNVPLLKEKNQPADVLRKVSGEAHFLRAFYYFTLANIYGQPYRTASAASDYSVPLKTEPKIEGSFFTRSTVQKVYDQIVADLLQAEQELQGLNESLNNRANQAAAQLLLSRVYLHMEEYEKAHVYAEKVISHRNYKVADLNAYVEGVDFASRNSAECIFTMGRSFVPYLMQSASDAPVSEFYRVSGNLASMYASNDLRLNAFYFQTSKGYLKCGKQRQENGNERSVSDNWGLRISEAYLNNAEALAMLGRDADAVNVLQELRKYRFKPGELSAVTATAGALVSFIRDERRRELSFESHRWFDLRRYGVNTKYPFSKLIRHNSYAYSVNGYTQNGYYELKPYDQDKAAFVIPIARDELEFNNGNLTNEARPQRPLQQ